MSEKPIRVLFFAEAVTLAHVSRCIALANALFVTQKYEIALAVDDRFDHLLGKLSYPKIPLHSISCALMEKMIAKASPIYDTSIIEEYIEEDLKVIDDFKPDFIFGDFRLSLGISSRIKKIPYATITNSYWSPFADIVYPVSLKKLINLFGLTIAQKIFNFILPFGFKHHATAFNDTCKKFGLPLMGKDLRDIYTHADYTLYADIESIIPMKPLPENHLFIGPIFWSANVDLPIWWGSLPDDKPIIYLTLGSSGDYSTLPLIIEALSGMSVSVICVTAKKAILKKTYQNVYLTEFLPAVDAVKKADIVICNGGSPMVYQSIAENKYVIGVPNNLDQYLIMTQAEKSGYGLLLRSSYITSDSIVKAVEHALSKDVVQQPSGCELNINKITSLIDSVV